MRGRWHFVTTGLLILGLTLPALAVSPLTASVKFDHSVMIAGITLSAGRYEFHAGPDSTSVAILKEYDEISHLLPGQGYTWELRTQLIATVRGEWVLLASRANKTEVISNADHIRQIDFRGEMKAIRFSTQAWERQD